MVLRTALNPTHTKRERKIHLSFHVFIHPLIHLMFVGWVWVVCVCVCVRARVWGGSRRYHFPLTKLNTGNSQKATPIAFHCPFQPIQSEKNPPTAQTQGALFSEELVPVSALDSSLNSAPSSKKKKKKERKKIGSAKSHTHTHTHTHSHTHVTSHLFSHLFVCLLAF